MSISHDHCSQWDRDLLSTVFHLNKRTCLNKRASRPLNLTGHISETTEMILIIFLPPKVTVFLGPESRLQVSSKSDKGKGSCSASVPGAFIRQNTVYCYSLWHTTQQHTYTWASIRIPPRTTHCLYTLRCCEAHCRLSRITELATNLDLLPTNTRMASVQKS